MSPDVAGVLTTFIATIPPTIASLAAWRHVRANGRGTLRAQLERIEDKVDDLVLWRRDHERQGLG